MGERKTRAAERAGRPRKSLLRGIRVPSHLRRFNVNLQQTLTAPEVVREAGRAVVEALFAVKVHSWPIELPAGLKPDEREEWRRRQKQVLARFFGASNVEVAHNRVYVYGPDHDIRLQAARESLDRHQPRLNRADQNARRSWRVVRKDANEVEVTEQIRGPDDDEPLDFTRLPEHLAQRHEPAEE